MAKQIKKRSKLATASHSKLRENISKKLKIGATRLKFKKEAAEKIFSENYTSRYSNTLARDLIAEKEKYLTIIPPKRRLYKIFYNKKKIINEKKSQHKISDKVKPDFVKEKLDRYNALRKLYKIKDIYKDLNSIRYKLDKKLISKKDLHMKKLRAFRKNLAENKKLLNSKEYRRIYLKVKGNFYNTLGALELDIKSSIRP